MKICGAFLTKSDKTAASPIPKLIIIAVDISEFFGKYFIISIENLGKRAHT